MNKIMALVLILWTYHSAQSSLPADFGHFEAAQNVMNGWGGHAAEVMRGELSKLSSKESCAIIFGACGLCNVMDAQDEKINVAMTLLSYKSTDRNQILPMAVDLKKHFNNTGSPRQASEILDVFFLVPAYQRFSIYQKLKQKKILHEYKLIQYAKEISNHFGWFEILSMKAYYSFSGYIY